MNLHVAFAVLFSSYLAFCIAEKQLLRPDVDAEPWLTDRIGIDEIPAVRKLGKSSMYNGGEDKG